VDYEVVLTEPARDDLREIVAFIAQDNPHAAVTFRDRLIAEAETLIRFPQRGRFMRRRGNVRKLVCRPYLILYRIAKSQRTVEILRFWHSARGTPRL
jgi:toxin ParE1/3/4